MPGERVSVKMAKGQEKGEDPAILKEALRKLDEGRALREKGEMKEAVLALGRALALMDRTDTRPEDRVRALVEAARANIRLGDVDKAGAAAIEAVGLITRPGMSSELKGDALLVHGTCLSIKGSSEEGLRTLLRAMALYEIAHNKEGIAATCRNIGNIYHSLSNVGKALAYYRRAYTILKDMGSEEAWTVRHNIANMTSDSGLYDDAFREFEVCLEHFKAIGNRRLMAFAHVNIGHVLIHLARWDEALDHLDHAILLADQGGNLATKQGGTFYKCEALLGKGDLKGASVLMDASFRSISSAGVALDMADVHRVRGMIRREMGDLERAESDFKVCEQMCIDGNFKMELAYLYIEWAKLKLGSGDRARAMRLFGKARTNYRELKLPLLERELERTMKGLGF